jgi:Protein kinase domain/PH domain
MPGWKGKYRNSAKMPSPARGSNEQPQGASATTPSGPARPHYEDPQEVLASLQQKKAGETGRGASLDDAELRKHTARQQIYATSPSPSSGDLEAPGVRSSVPTSLHPDDNHGSVTQGFARTSPSAPTGLSAEAGLNMSAAAMLKLEDCAMSGWLSKRGGGKLSKAYRRRFFVLCGDNLFYFKGEKEKRPQGVIARISKHVVNEEEGGSNYFALEPSTADSRAFHLLAKTEEEKRRWVRSLPTAQDASAARIEEKLVETYNIPPEAIEWEGGDTLGKGASGVVKRGTWLKTQTVAVKLLNNVPEFIDADEFREFFTEIDTLSQLRHPCIVSMFGFAKKDGYLALVTEFVGGGDLAAAIHDSRAPLCARTKILLLQSVVKGMVYLHSKGVIHRDLKPGNILIENLLHGKVKVCDFGLSAVQSAVSGEPAKVVYGSPAYAAPELPQPNHTDMVDVFSFAVVAWELWLRERPWREFNYASEISTGIHDGIRPDVMLVVVTSTLAPQYNADNTHTLQRLITQCWDLSPDVRLPFADIFNVVRACYLF